MTVQAVQEMDEAALADLVHEFFGVPRDLLKPTATFDDLGLDSLALMELMVVLEERSGGELLERLMDLSPASTLRAAAQVVQDAAGAGSETAAVSAGVTSHGDHTPPYGRTGVSVPPQEKGAVTP
ncbi:acyl carrier protein [Streptomyces sp. NPDC048550]|uniref:acyl carrier protein n=1 Tax=Streptomyces sp. NPDC048550 TaxID=3155739 RepID=UPI003437E9E4